MDAASILITLGIIFLSTLASGVWLSNSGKPLNTVIFTIHKLIALAAAIFTGMAIYNLIKIAEIQFFIVALIVIVGLCVLALFVTGALMSSDKPVNDIFLTIHKVAPFLLAIAMVETIYILMGKKP